ncbi:MAG: MarR family winged helix-turn-helix transcriptional regulator [Leptospirales bacterium]
MTRSSPSGTCLGELLQQFVNHVSHRAQGETLSIMHRASVTLPQVLLMSRLLQREDWTSSALASSLNMSLPSVSQMIDRLSRQGLIRRIENPDDRRQRRITLTSRAKSLMTRIGRARSAEYAVGVSRLSPALQHELADILTRVLAELVLLGKNPDNTSR